MTIDPIRARGLRLGRMPGRDGAALAPIADGGRQRRLRRRLVRQTDKAVARRHSGTGAISASLLAHTVRTATGPAAALPTRVAALVALSLEAMAR